MSFKGDFFTTGAAKKIVKMLDGVEGGRCQRATVFDDWLTIIVAELAGGTMEAEYLAAIKRYRESGHWNASLKIFAESFSELVTGMENESPDVLGDIFQGGITWGEHGQFFTPWELCRLMAKLCGADQPGGCSVSHDPACGSGRTLLAAAEQAGPMAGLRRYTGADIDSRCARMAAINLALAGLTGWVIHGSSLSLEVWGCYEVGSFEAGGRRGLIRKSDRKLATPAADRRERPAAAAPFRGLGRIVGAV